MNTLLNNKLRAQIAIATLLVIVFAEGMGIISLLGGSNEGQDITGISSLAIIVSIVILVFVFITGPIAFLIWFYRAYKNLHIAGLFTFYTPGWAIGSFFVPFINLIRPYRIMQEILLGTQELTKDKISSSWWNENRQASLVKWWWGLYLLSLVDLKFGRYSLDNTWYGASFDIAAAAVTIILIKKISEFESIAFEKYKGKQIPNPADLST
jgi:hypothetical protein